jgi:hypothetical protein
VLAGILLAGPVFAQTASDQPVTQAQLNALYKRIEQLEKELAEIKAAPQPVAGGAVATSAAPQSVASSGVAASSTSDAASTQARIDAVSARVDKLEKPTSIKIGSVTIKPYGYIKLDAAYNSQKPSPAAGDFTLFTQPKVAGKSDSQLDFSARDSRFGLDFSLPEEKGITTTAKFENDFIINGTESAYSVRLRLAYVDLAFGDGWSVRAGHDWDAFFYVAPVTVDAGFLGDSGYLYSRRAQIKLTKVTDVGEASKFTAKVAVANTSSGDLDGLGQDDGIDSGRPTVEGLLAFDTPILTSKPAKFSVGGEFGTETLDAAGKPDDKDYDSSLVVAGVYLPIVDQLAVQGNLWTGKNLDGWLGGVGQGINTTLKKSVDASGGWAQLVYTPTADWNLSLGYGADNPKDDNLNAGGRAKNTRLFTGVIYKLTKSVSLSAEYSIISTDYKGADDAKNNRVQFSTKYQF